MFTVKIGKRRKGKLMLDSRKILTSVSYLVVFMGVVSFVLSTTANVSTPLGVITSESMTPILNIGDIVFIQPARVDDIRVGDVIAFRGSPSTVIIHRVEDILEYPGVTYLLTKGDANDVVDQSVGMPHITYKNLLGRTLFVDGVPVKIPLIGRLWMELYNVSVWLTQNKPWSLWAPILALAYICWPSGLGKKRLFQKPMTRRSLNKKQMFTITFIAFVGISLFTLWFRVEQYSLGMRVASLKDFSQQHNFNYGSMIYGEVKDNPIDVTGAPLLPVKTVGVIKGNASLLASIVPRSLIAEPNAYLNMTLHAVIPSRGEVAGGLYEGTVHIFSSTLWTVIPDELLFAVFDALPDPWISAITLEVISSLMLASTIILAFAAGELTVKQVVYTFVWLRQLPEKGEPRRSTIWFKKTKKRVRGLASAAKTGLPSLLHSLNVEGTLINPKVLFTIGAASFTIYYFTHSFTSALGLQCLLLGGFAVIKGIKREEATIGMLCIQTIYNGMFMVYSAASSMQGPLDFWTVAATGFTGSIALITTIPIALFAFILTYGSLSMIRIWCLEQETLGWVIIRQVQFALPSFERETVKIIPRQFDVRCYQIPSAIHDVKEPKKLVAEECKIIESLTSLEGTTRKLGLDRYADFSKAFIEMYRESEDVDVPLNSVEYRYTGTSHKWERKEIIVGSV